MEENSVDSIMAILTEWSKTKEIHAPGEWVDGCLKLVVLRGEEDDRLIELGQVVAKLKSMLMQDKQYSAARAKVEAEAGDEYRDYLKQKAKLERITEMVRLAKLRARLADEEGKGY